MLTLIFNENSNKTLKLQRCTLSYQYRRQYAGIKSRCVTQRDKWPRQFINKSRSELSNAPRIGIGNRSSLSKVVVKSDFK